MKNIILDIRGFSLFRPFIHILNYVIHDVSFFHELGICTHKYLHVTFTVEIVAPYTFWVPNKQTKF